MKLRLYRDILSIGLLIAALAWTLWFVFAGFGNHQDPLYWLYKYTQLEGGWMAVGTLLSGGAIVRIFGPELLPLRLAGWLCAVGAIALPYCCLLTKEQRRENIHWLALAYLLMGYGAFQEFSPGTLSVLLLSALWVSAAKAESGKRKAESVSAVLLGLAVAVRFPNILALLVLIPIWKKRSLWNIPIAAATAGLVYLLGYWLVTPAAMDAAMTSHDIWPMIRKLWEKGGLLVGYLFVGIGVLRAYSLTLSLKGTGNRVPIPAWGILVGLLLVYFLAMTTKATQWYNTDLTYFVSAMCLIIALSAKPLTTNPLTYGIAILIVATLGTDTAWLKLFPAVLCLLPVAGSEHEEAMRKYLWWVWVPIVALVMVRHSTNSVGRTDLTNVQTVSSIAPYSHIAITEAEEARLAQYKADFDSLRLTDERMRGVEVLALGQENHLMRAVTGCEAARYNEFWSNIFDSIYTVKYKPIIEQERPVVFCSFSPQFKTKKEYKDRQSAMEMMLREEGYREIDRSEFKYMIYVPDEGISGLED